LGASAVGLAVVDEVATLAAGVVLDVIIGDAELVGAVAVMGRKPRVEHFDWNSAFALSSSVI
jgi:hypothetical protein